MKISAKISEAATDKEGKKFPEAVYRTVEVDYAGIGDNLDDARKLNGDAVVYSRYESASVIDVQALVRRQLKAGASDANIQEAVTEFKLGVKQVVRKDPREKALAALDALPPEIRKQILTEAAQKLKGVKAA